ncbi:MAG: hypothetical protein US97_C0007G0009 [Microgenomates group bacterium GW2011_GWF1_38_5]|nr:MAG: hypothetical protein US97_C0007G0009 [Microgenomates group bacterium GW2011_GWF1_38_5]
MLLSKRIVFEYVRESDADLMRSFAVFVGLKEVVF